MKIAKAKFLIDENLEIQENKAMVFDEKIEFIGDFNSVAAKFKKAEILDFKDSIIAPSFVNTHIHLEFSANKSTLFYGDFIKWIGSIIENSKNLSKKCTNLVMKKAINSMLKSGISSVGAISSFGKDGLILSQSPLRVVHFNEILGSNEEFIEQNFDNFIKRFKESTSYANYKFKPAISLHAPYSIHPKLGQKALDFAKKEKLLVSTHFMESDHEKEWLTKSGGKFKEHLQKFTKEPKPLYSPQSFFNMFCDSQTLFTHAVYADNFDKFKQNHSITHCPRSNRLLGKKALNLKEVIKNNISLNIGTDGLSSNLSLNFFDEIRAAIFTHNDFELNELCKILFHAATLGGAKALGLNNGVLKVEKDADFMVIKAPKCQNSQLLTQTLLHTKKVKNLFIGGKIANF